MVKKKVYPRHTLNIDGEAFKEAFRMVLSGGASKDNYVKEFEREFSTYIGAPFALGIGSARKGFYLVLKSFGFGKNDEVIMPSYAFHALPTAVIACGLRPVFVDVLPQTYNIDPSLIEKAISKKTKAIVVTHMFGQPCDMDPINEIAGKYNLVVIEDCAHACGAKYGNRRAGALGDAAVFSFKMGKDLPCFGGGMITIRDEKIYNNVRELTENLPGSRRTEILNEIMYTLVCFFATQKQIFKFLTYPMIRLLSFLGFDWIERQTREEADVRKDLMTFQKQTRLSYLQAAVGLKRLKLLDEVTRLRRRNTQKLAEKLRGVGNIAVPEMMTKTEPTCLYFRILVKDPKAFKKKLLSRGVDTKLDDMSACSQLEDFAEYHVSCPVAERLPLESIGVPNNRYLTDDDIRYITEQIRFVSNETEHGS